MILGTLSIFALPVEKEEVEEEGPAYCIYCSYWMQPLSMSGTDHSWYDYDDHQVTTYDMKYQCINCSWYYTNVVSWTLQEHTKKVGTVNTCAICLGPMH